MCGLSEGGASEARGRHRFGMVSLCNGRRHDVLVWWDDGWVYALVQWGPVGHAWSARMTSSFLVNGGSGVLLAGKGEHSVPAACGKVQRVLTG